MEINEGKKVINLDFSIILGTLSRKKYVNSIPFKLLSEKIKA